MSSFVPDPLDDTLPSLDKEPSHPEHSQGSGERLLSGMQFTITAIRATDLTLGLRRIPAGFHVTVQTDDAEWQTGNTPVHLDQDVVQWNERILLPCESSSRVRFRVYASFELDPMLGSGELLCTVETTVGELLNRSEKSHPIVFQPKEGEVVSSCTSLFMAVAHRRSSEYDAALHPTAPLMSADMRTLVLMTDVGHRLLARYRRTQNSWDLDQCTRHFERASDLCPIDHPCRPAALSNLAIARFVFCQASGTYPDLDIPISLFQDALDLRPAGHPDRPINQLHLAIALLSRFAKRGFQTDADTAEKLLSEILDVCLPNSHPHRAALLAIETFALYPAGIIAASDHGQEQPVVSMLPLSLNQLAHAVEWCSRRDDPHVLDEAISLHYDALGYYSTAHARRGQLLGNLGTLLWIRFERQGNSQDLSKAIAVLREAQALHPVGHPNRSASLVSLAATFLTRFRHWGNDQDLDEAIVLEREALALRPVGHPDRSLSLNNVATTLTTCFMYRGNVQDIDEAIALHREALVLHPVGHQDRSTSMSNLASALFICFKHRGNDQDLDEAIAFYMEALALHSVGHPHRSGVLDNIATTLSTRFERRGNDQDLNEAIMLHREGLALRHVGHLDRPSSLNHLANTLFTRFGHRGNDQDLDEAVTLHREVLAFLPVGHPDWSASVNDLALGLSTRFQHRGDGRDLNEAIMLHKKAMALFPVGHPNRSKSLNNLATTLFTRFKHRGDDQDLDEAITLHREALALFPVGHTDRSSSLNNLANALSTRFEYRGNDQDLDKAIVLHREALASHPAGHPDRSGSLNSLASELFIRFRRRGNDQDLDEAITLDREGLALRPIGHPDRSSSLSNLANELFTRFQRRDNDQDLDEAVALHREGLALHLVGHPDRSTSLNNLAIALTICFKHRGGDQDLDEAITLDREALALRPVGHPDRSTSLNNLATGLSTRFEHQGNVQDLNEALENLRHALSMLTQNGPRQLMVHRSLATVYLLVHQSGFNSIGEDTDTVSLDAAMYHFKAAANIVSGGLLSRLRASLGWACHADQHTHHTDLEAYSTSMQLLDAYMSATASVSSRRDTMKAIRHTLAVDAASCALRRGDVCRAIELLEQGRTLIWTQMARFRTPFDILQERGDYAEALMKKFRDISSLLDKPPLERQDGTPRINAEAEVTRYTRLVENWNKVVEEIRKLEGFSRFLLPPLFSDLQDAARDGPIIVLVASESSCDAIIIPYKKPPTSFQLPINLDKLMQLVLALRENIDKEASPKKTQPGLIKTLRELWDDVVHPVVENLDRFARRGSRIWWCPTSLFNFLPLHAAGEYKRGGKSLSQLYVSSYTPSLTALTRARKSNGSSLSVSFSAIGQNHPPGHSFPLEAVEPELELVQSLLPPPPTVFFTKVTSAESTKAKVLQTLQDNRWLHFACHGTQNLVEPFKSAFLMSDQPLSLLDITQRYLSQHEFAFLSACETALGDFTTPDEVIHLAAALQFAGVKSVIGTLWRVNDATVRRLVEAFYKNFCGDGTMNSKRAARALHRAVQSLACDTDMPLDQRIVFIHIGL